MVQQVVGELRDGEDVDQVEEQLDRPYLGLPFTPLAQLPEVAFAHRYSPGLSRRAEADLQPTVRLQDKLGQE